MQASADLDEASECPQHITPKIVCLDESEKSSESVVPTTENRNAIEADTVKKISLCPDLCEVLALLEGDDFVRELIIYGYNSDDEPTFEPEPKVILRKSWKPLGQPL